MSAENVAHRAAIHLNCPHCQNPIELLAGSPEDEVLCPSCGSSFKLDPDRTQTWSKDKLPTLGKFELLEPVGRGAFGTVYRARDIQLGRVVAVKVPRSGQLSTEEDEDRFIREARNAAQLQHSGIVPVYEVGRSETFSYIVSEFVEGITLADALTAGKFGIREGAKLVAQVAAALHHAHGQGVVHRDLKPSNIMLASDGTPRVMDFGLAKRDAGEITVTVDGQVLGTPAYMSPEQASGQAHHVDGRSDVYSLGSIFYQLLTGELPFRGNQRMLLHQVLHDEPRAPRSLNDRIPRDLETICLKAMAKEPGRRYESAQAMADDLNRYLHGHSILARPVGQFEKSWRWVRRNPLVATLSTAIVLLLALGAALSTLVAVQASNRAREATLLAIEAREQRQRADENAQRADEAAQLADENARLARENARLARIGAGEDVQAVSKAVAKALEGRTLLAANAKPQSTYEEQLSTIATKADLVDSLLNTQTMPSDKEISTLFNELIEPSIAEAEKIENRDVTFNKLLARLYFWKCRVIRLYPEVPWPFENQLAKALEAIERAVELDPGKSEYLAERGDVLLSQNKLDLSAKDAELAIARDANLFDGHALQAKLLLKRARQERNRGKVAELLKQSVAAGEKAVSLAKDNNKRFVCLLDLGTSYTEWANYVDAKDHSPNELLKKAIEAVRHAQSIDDASYSDYAFARLGNAYEDLAWHAKVSVDANYNAAIDEFSKAIAKRPDLAGPRLDLGRCYYKREADSGQRGKGYMEMAFENLSRAVQLDRTESNPSPRYWLGKVYLYQATDAAKEGKDAQASAKSAKAEMYFAQAKELAEKQGSPNATNYAVAWAGARLDDASFDKSKIRDQVDKLLKSEDVRADKNYMNELCLLKAKSLEREGNAIEREARTLNGDAKKAKLRQRDKQWNDAIETYGVGLGPDPAKNDILDISLLKARANLHLSMASRSSYELATKDAIQILKLMGQSADADAFYLAARTHFMAAATLSPPDKEKAAAKFKQVVEYFDKAIDAASDDQRSFQMFEDHAFAIKTMITNDPSLIANWRPKAKKSIERALQMAQQAPPQKRAVLQRLKNEIDRMPEAARQPESSNDIPSLASDRRGGGGLLEDLQRARQAEILTSAPGAPLDAVSPNQQASPPLKKSSAKPATKAPTKPADVEDLFKESPAAEKPTSEPAKPDDVDDLFKEAPSK